MKTPLGWIRRLLRREPPELCVACLKLIERGETSYPYARGRVHEHCAFGTRYAFKRASTDFGVDQHHAHTFDPRTGETVDVQRELEDADEIWTPGLRRRRDPTYPFAGGRGL